MFERLWEAYPIYESLIAGLILSSFMGVITTNRKGKTRRPWYIFTMRMISLLSGIGISGLFVEFNEASFKTIEGYQDWILQFIIIYSVSEAIYKFGGKDLVNKFIGAVLDKIGGLR